MTLDARNATSATRTNGSLSIQLPTQVRCKNRKKVFLESETVYENCRYVEFRPYLCARRSRNSTPIMAGPRGFEPRTFHISSFLDMNRFLPCLRTIRNSDDAEPWNSPLKVISVELANVLSKAQMAPAVFGRAKQFGLDPSSLRRMRKLMLAYLLGFMIGDASKGRASSKSGRMFIGLVLTKRHPENRRLGEFVGLCANACGLKFSRIHDRVLNERLPYGRYHWKSEHSTIVTWLFNRCLGLRYGQLTTYDAARVAWVASMPRTFKIWFLQGLGDSDGYVRLQDQEVHLITSPNTKAVRRILDSMRVKYRLGISKNLDIIQLPVLAASKLPIFSPHVNSYRYSLMMNLASARRLRSGPWPSWLRKRVVGLANRNKTTGQILRRVLEQYHIAIRAPNVRRYTKHRRTGQ